MSARAKFQVDSVGYTVQGATVKMTPVADGPENEQFFKSAPAGQLLLTPVSAEVAKQFEPGKAYFVNFTPVPAE